MKLRIEINCNNSAFDDSDCGYELGRILNTINLNGLSKLDCSGLEQDLRDINGNKVGHLKINRFSKIRR